MNSPMIYYGPLNQQVKELVVSFYKNRRENFDLQRQKMQLQLQLEEVYHHFMHMWLVAQAKDIELKDVVYYERPSTSTKKFHIYLMWFSEQKKLQLQLDSECQYVDLKMEELMGQINTLSTQLENYKVKLKIVIEQTKFIHFQLSRISWTQPRLGSKLQKTYKFECKSYSSNMILSLIPNNELSSKKKLKG